MSSYVTIMDIAKELGVSHSTVSRALRDHPRISKKTIAKVKKLADERGYWSNDAVRNITQGHSGIIGIIVPDLSIPFFSRVLLNIQSELFKQNYSALVFNSAESAEAEKVSIEKCLMHRVDGIIAAITIETKDFSTYEKVLKQGVPIVFYDRVSNFLNVPKVVADDYVGSYNANKYLIEQGCKIIAHITGTINLNNSNNRLYGYLDALSENGLKANESLIHYYEFEPSSIDDFLKKVLAKYGHIDAISTFNDYTAYYAVQSLIRLGLKVPDNVFVIGFSNEPIATYMRPSLSTVEEVAPKMGTIAAQKMVSILNGSESLTSQKISILPGLILRETTKKRD
ncbi:MAG: LacI family DNA-binding transcriptional regulator [Cyclobacteriaceae bacterium]